MYDEDELKKILLKHGYCSMRTENNFTYSTHRYTLQCKLNDKEFMNDIIEGKRNIL